MRRSPRRAVAGFGEFDDNRRVLQSFSTRVTIPRCRRSAPGGSRGDPPRRTHVSACQSPRRRAEDHGQQGFQPQRTRQPDHSLHRGRRHRRRHHAGDDPGRRRGRREGLRRQAQDSLDGSLRRREIDAGLRSRRLASRRDARDRSRLRGLDQRSAHDAGWRGHTLAQRRAAPTARPVRLPAAGPLLRGRAEPAQVAREDRHGDLSRELRGHLRGHRVGGRIGGREEDHRFPHPRDGRQEDPLPRRRPRSASSRCRAKAPSG